MLIKNISKNKFIVPGAKKEESPSKIYPKGRIVQKTVQIAPGAHAEVPEAMALKLFDQYPNAFVEYVAPKPRPAAVPKPDAEGKKDGDDFEKGNGGKPGEVKAQA